MAEGPLDAILRWLSTNPGIVDQMQASHQRFQDVATRDGLAAAMRDPVHDQMAANVAGNFDFTGPVGMAGIIRAYHGSPHTFDKFDMGNIGTGEGAQAFGHGLYFAENPAVAKSYQENLSGGRGVTPTDLAARVLGSFNGDKTKAINELDRRLASAEKRAAEDPAGSADFEAFRQRVQDAKYSISSGNPSGSFYAVDLNVNPEDLLHWGVPLSEQPEKVRKALKDSGILDIAKKAMDELYVAGPSSVDKMTGEDLYQGIVSMQPWNGGPRTDKKAATEILRAAGIPGIRYLDGSSRTHGDGTHNIVMFDHEPVQIVERNGQPVGMGIGR